MFKGELGNDTNEPVEVRIDPIYKSGRLKYIEIWQGSDLVEFEIEKVPELIELLQSAIGRVPLGE